MIEAFKQIADLATGAAARQKAEYDEFLLFYRGLVETLPAEAVKLFGKIERRVVVNGQENTYGILLTATDFAWWHQSIRDGVRFLNGPAKTKVAMFERMGKIAEDQTLEPKERKELLALLLSE